MDKLIKIQYILITSAFLFTGFIVRHQFSLNKKKVVLILGNSITKHEPAPEIGWFGDWGMAASKKDKDFVHILEKHIKSKCLQSIVAYKNIADFEKEYWKYDLSKFSNLRDMHPDLLILKIGENVDRAEINENLFELHYIKLIEYFRSKNSNIRIICVSSFWENERVDKVIQHAAKESKSSYVQLGKLSLDTNNTAIGKFKNPGVALHPSDRGMASIASAICTKILALK